MKTIRKIILSAIGVSLVACGSVNLKLKKEFANAKNEEGYRIEYTGEIIDVTLEQLIENITELKTDDLVENSIITANTTSFEDGEEVLESSQLKLHKDGDIGMPYFSAKDLGTYEVQLSYKKTTTGLNVIVEDTTAPSIRKRVRVACSSSRCIKR